MHRKFGLIGYPLGHSFSRSYHNERFTRMGVDAEYNNYELDDISLLPHLLMDVPNLFGLNVTIPYKQAVLPFLDEIDDVAKSIGAVNVIRIERDNCRVRMVGYNTDYIGFRNSISPFINCCHTSALVLGTGGASKAVSTALRDMGIAVQIVSRNSGMSIISYEELTSQIVLDNKIIINATPLGMYPNVDTYPSICYDAITSQHLCYDVVYNPANTRFMQLCAARGAVVCNGLKMLYGQADAAWEIWNR